MFCSMNTLLKMPSLCYCVVLALSLVRTHADNLAAEVSTDLHWRSKSKLRRRGQPLQTYCIQKYNTLLCYWHHLLKSCLPLMPSYKSGNSR